MIDDELESLRRGLQDAVMRLLLDQPSVPADSPDGMDRLLAAMNAELRKLTPDELNDRWRWLLLDDGDHGTRTSPRLGLVRMEDFVAIDVVVEK